MSKCFGLITDRKEEKMDKIKLENKLTKAINEKLDCSLEKVRLEETSFDFDFQINVSFELSKILKKNPREIAKDIEEVLNELKLFKEIEISGAGFINVRLNDEIILDYVNKQVNKIQIDNEVGKGKQIIIDYGGANAAKILHVGHLRAANIGEALKRLYRALGYEAIGDVHLGDIGTQAGLVVESLKEKYPNLICFDEDYNGEDFELPIKIEDLKNLYPDASSRAKIDKEFKKRADEITYLIQHDHLGYKTLWIKVRDLSVIEIKKLYKRLNVNFELWEGELDSFKYIPEALDYYKEKGLLYQSEGALVVDIKKDDDKTDMPPVLLVKSNGSYLYQTTDLGTIWGRLERFNPDIMLYVVDERQALHFEQLFRLVKKGDYADNLTLIHAGFGTITGEDKKPFKTRDGSVMGLANLIDLVYQKCLEKVDSDITGKKREEIAKNVGIAALKYADLLSFRKTNYVFNLDKFTDFEGKTGPYILYTAIRIKSLLEKNDLEITSSTLINSDLERKIYLEIFKLEEVMNKGIVINSLNEICEYIYKLSSLYSSFYNKYHILTEPVEELKMARLVLSKTVFNTLAYLLEIFAIKLPEEM